MQADGAEPLAPPHPERADATEGQGGPAYGAQDRYSIPLSTFSQEPPVSFISILIFPPDRHDCPASYMNIHRYSSRRWNIIRVVPNGTAIHNRMTPARTTALIPALLATAAMPAAWLTVSNKLKFKIR